MKTPDLIEACRSPAAFPGRTPLEVTVLQTHISVLFFAGDRVYKVKKPLRLDFLDYSTLERRRRFCEEEVRLNRRLAPDVYLGVVPITRGRDRAVRVGGSGEILEYAVEMVRLPEERMMSALLARGEIDNRQMDELVELLVDFHGEAERGPGVDEYGEPAEIVRQLDANFGELREHVGAPATESGAGTISATLRDHLHAAARDWLRTHDELLRERVRNGRIREGHGDLHTGNICLKRSRVVIYDCIEFSRAFRCRDVACELAFLAMDLDYRGFRGFAGYLLHRYAELTDDPDLPVAAELYRLHLASVRGKVASIRAEASEVAPAERESARREAMRYFHLAASYTLPPALVLTCGLPASGKSYAARAIARPFEAALVRSDVVRKELAGVPLHSHRGDELDAGIYTPEFSRRTYAAVLDRTSEHLGHGKTVVVDATFSAANRRRPFFALAAELGVACVLVEMTCPEDVVRDRMQRRADDADEVSDADWCVYEQARDRFEPPEEVPAAQRLRLDSRRAGEETAAAVVDRLVGLATRS